MLPVASLGYSHSLMSVAPRKSAKQQRSRFTIEALLEATARIVAQVGLDRATTNRIAEVAGVSIGSLYQYFPGKEALLAALIEREARADLATVRATLHEHRARPLVEIIERTVAHYVARPAQNPGLYRWMVTYVPALGQHPKLRALASEGRALLAQVLREHRDELPPRVDPDVAAMILGSAVEAALQSAIIERPAMLADGTLAAELVTLCRRYLGVSAV